MVGKLLTMALAVMTLLSIAAAADAAPPTMNLSSWEPVVADGAIVGGTQTVTIINITQREIADITFALDVPPCECSVAASTASDGLVSGDAWTIDELGPGATATMTLKYVDARGVPAGTTGNAHQPPGGRVLAIAAIAAVLGILFIRPRRLANVAA